MDTIRRLWEALPPPAFPTRCRSRRIVSNLLRFALSLSVLVFPSCLAAQELGMLTGIVSTTEKKPLGQARISVVGTALGAVADTDGSFRIGALPLGNQSVEVKLLGYASVLVPVQIERAKTATLDVTLEAVPLPLETVTVTGDTLIVPGMRGFQERKERGIGRFFTREDIERMQVRLFSDILRRVPGMQVQSASGSYGQGMSVQTGRTQSLSGGRTCPVVFYVNGAPFPLTHDIAINNYVSPDEVAAVEVYTGTSQIPAQFSSSQFNTRCGVVVIWTRSSNDPRRSR